MSDFHRCSDCIELTYDYDDRGAAPPWCKALSSGSYHHIINNPNIKGHCKKFVAKYRKEGEYSD